MFMSIWATAILTAAPVSPLLYRFRKLHGTVGVYFELVWSHIVIAQRLFHKVYRMQTDSQQLILNYLVYYRQTVPSQQPMP